jgi:hypothetical protein
MPTPSRKVPVIILPGTLNVLLKILLPLKGDSVSSDAYTIINFIQGVQHG